MVCVRCGKQIKAIYRHVVAERTYLVAYHGRGVRCYLGPEESYVYATTTHNFMLEGARNPQQRARNYLQAIINELDTSNPNLLSLLREIKIWAEQAINDLEGASNSAV